MNNNIDNTDVLNKSFYDIKDSHIDNTDILNKTFYDFQESYIGNVSKDIIDDILTENLTDDNNNSQSLLHSYNMMILLM